ncbi:DNA-dependent RNA polymerase auxiliary subunit epsilon family protein [Anaerobacillus sp. CMMVII]|uniref:DNA-dependent RNA polymerase subunit epsilon n=1 Tax=Anaerobacillus sp. CMMVII TaxID=2755588 RepID=UPI0021B70F6C|nr:DNA-directed RNA polymerase subunit epsilon [Anaerobacillus sp. CMMVII]MCT8139100.1 DNA-dependent RNA polymerase auxiliary subunit epsilon family protein [Anaerobacillus sp. CMMVII]
MIYKVLYQERLIEVPVREKTQSLYVEASSEMEVRQMLAQRPYNIEFVLPVDGDYLEYEKQNENFKVENV